MRKNPIIALLLTVVMLFAVVAPTYADGYDAINNLIASGKMSDDEVYTVYVDMSLASEGSVTSTVYETVYEQTTVQNHAVSPQPYTGVNGAKDKLSRFFLFLSHNHSDHVMGLKGATPDETVAGYVYGQRKSEVINTYISGIVDCLGNPALWTGGNSGGHNSNNVAATTETTTDVVPDNPDSWAEKYLTTTFSLNTKTYTTSVTGLSTTDETTTLSTATKEMDVTPYIKDGRTYVPVRYLAYALGVSENDIKWSQEFQQVIITLNNNKVVLTIGSTTMWANGASVTMDVAPEIVDGRTCLPARWVAEALGATVKWDEELNQAIIIMPTQ